MRISDWSSDVCSSDLHQVLAVSRRDQHALPPCESALTADIEEPLDLLVDATDYLHVTVLVDRAGHREILADRHLGEGGEQGGELGAGRAVAVDAAVGLLEHQAGRERQRSVDGEVAREVGGEDQNALGVEGPAQIDLALDVDHLAGTHAHPGRDATRPTGGEAAELPHAERYEERGVGDESG